MNPQPLRNDQVGNLLKLLDLTQDREFTCGECLMHVGEFAESKLAGLPLDEALILVEQHLALCPECREECEALMEILKAQS
jgi:hypothetical protein